MAVWEDVAAVDGREDLTPRQKQLEKYRLKVSALVDWLNNGKPPPQPLPSPIGQTYAFNGFSYTLHYASERIERAADGEDVSLLAFAFTAVRQSDGAKIVTAADEFRIVSPPIYTGDRRQHLIDTAKEILESIVQSRLTGA